MRHGVYTITNTITGKVYVGSASKTTFKRRWAKHRQDLQSGNHHSRYLQRAWEKAGPDAFMFEVLEECDPQECLGREQYWMNMLQSYNPLHGYNMASSARNCIGVRHTEATKAKQRERRVGVPLSKAHAAAIRKSWDGRTISDDHKEKLRAAHPSKSDYTAWVASISATRSRRPVIATSLVDGSKLEFESITAARKAGYDAKSISLVCDGVQRKHKGYTWTWKNFVSTC